MKSYKENRADAPWRAFYLGTRVMYGVCTYTPPNKFKSAKQPVAGAIAEYEGGSHIKVTTGGRVVAGAVLAGPVGMLVGGLIKKDKSKGYITITFSDGETTVIEGPLKDESRMRSFVARFNKASQHFAELEVAPNPSQATSSSHPAATASSLTAQDEHQAAR